MELKRWLSGLLPEDMSRQDVAEELGVTRKTISNMLNPDQEGFGNGLTMLRYLQLVGAARDVPGQAPGLSRLESLEAKVDETIALVTEALQLLRAAPPRDAEAQQAAES